MEHELDRNPGERALGRLLRESHLATPDTLLPVVAHAFEELGGRDVQVLLIDHSQTFLVRIDDPDARLSVEGTVAGRAFRLVSLQQVDAHDGQRIWVPILDGLERLGVIGVTFDALEGETRSRVRRVASLFAEILISKTVIGDGLQRVARTKEMSIAAEMQWSLLPPLTAGNEDLTVAASLEPSYDVGGDLVDYAFDAGSAHVAVLDAMGHGRAASLLSSLAIATYRNRRRAGEDLPEIAGAMEAAIAEQFGDSIFVTAILAVVDTVAGRLRWVNAGHPPPLLLRGGRVVKELAGVSSPPLGVGLASGYQVFEAALEPGDRILLYTDGVIEARTPEGELFGVERLTDFVVRADASAEPIAETMRRLSHAVLEHQQGELRDDATQMLVEWRTGSAQDITERFLAPPD